MGVLTSCERSRHDAAVAAVNADSINLALLKEAYLYGYPLMVMNATMETMTKVDKPVNSDRLLAPVNQLVNAVTFPDDKFRDVVRANCDTYYTMGWLNLKNNTIKLTLPDTKGRYYLFPLLDAWTNVFASPGKRTSGTGAQQYLITPSGWKGEVPAGVTVIESPTNLVWMIGRVQVNSKHDGSTIVKAIQNGITLEPSTKADGPAAGSNPSGTPIPPNDIVTGMSAAQYFSLLNKLMVDNPPAPADSAFLKSIVRLGIAPGATFDSTQFSSALRDSLLTLPQWGKTIMLNSGLGGKQLVEGWAINKGLGSYGTNYQFRAGVAYNGLGANLDADAVYPAAVTDADGDPFDGSKHKYVLHFDADKLPPAKAFWSLTMYDADGFMCPNPINRFTIGDRDKLLKNKDGSIDIYIQNDKPSSTNNWLPAPEGPFNLLLRIYWPDEKVINGQWMPSGIKKVKS
jgi:hypothetical protein